MADTSGFFLVLVVLICGRADRISAAQAQNKTGELHLLGLLPFTKGAWLGGKAALLTMNMAIEHINNRTDVLPDHTLKLHYRDSQCLGGPGTNALFEQLYTPPVKHIVIGDACSVVCQPTAEASYLWNISQVAYGCGSPSLSDKSKYPRFFRMTSPQTVIISPRFELMRLYDWKKIATIHQSYDLFSSVTDSMLEQLTNNAFVNGSVLTSEVFLTDPTQQVENLQKSDARIIFAGFYEDAALKVFCEAYKRKLYGAKYAWVTVGWYPAAWWQKAGQATDCTTEEFLEAIDGLFYTRVSFENPLDERGLAGISYSELMSLYKERTQGVPLSGETHVASYYDVVWTAALAMNQTINNLRQTGHAKDLAEFEYSDGDIGQFMTKAMFSTNFAGVMGNINFDEKGDPHRVVFIDQQQGTERKTVGYFIRSPNGVGGFMSWTDVAVKWIGGRPPRDSTTRVNQQEYVSEAIYSVMCTFSGIGMVISVCFLIFNFAFRRMRIIKMSSPNLNNVILLGCLLGYSTAFMQERPDGSLKEESLCVVRLVVFLAGFSMALGALFAKTWRIHKILTMSTKTLKKVVIKDSRLLGICLALVMVNMGIVVIWEVVDPLKLSIDNMSTRVSDKDPDVEITPQQHRCTCDYHMYFSGTLYIIQGAMLAFGAFLAWETRKVTVEALNDSKLIGMCIYNVLALSIMGTAVSRVVGDNMDVSYGFISGCIIFGTTLVQCIIFCPKLLGIRKGEGNNVVHHGGGTTASGSNAAPTGGGFLFKQAEPTNVTALPS